MEEENKDCDTSEQDTAMVAALLSIIVIFLVFIGFFIVVATMFK